MTFRLWVAAAGLLPGILSAQNAAQAPPAIVVLEPPGGAAFTSRLASLRITADCLPRDPLFREKRLFLYDVLVVLSLGTFEKEQYEDIKTFVRKGGVFVAFDYGGTTMDLDRNGRLNMPPDVVVSSKGGAFYDLTGGTRYGGGHTIVDFTILRASPITQGFAVGDRILANVGGLWVLDQSADTIVVCGDATVMQDKETARPKKGNVIQVRKKGKGASIWIAASIYQSREPWADRLLGNIFSPQTLEWCREQP